jgi:anti-sigma regulatory factor (Ser/Thr protein kinase)
MRRLKVVDTPFADQVRLVNSVTLAALPSAVKLSRALVHVTLRHWRLERLIDDTELVVSELVTNAVKATGIMEPEPSWSEREHLATIHVRLTHLEARIVIAVWDRDRTPPKPTDAAPDAETGRGLAIVEALCVRWDYFPAIGGGKVVWAELAIPPLPVTEAGLPIRIPEPVELGPNAPVINRDPVVLRRVRERLTRL